MRATETRLPAAFAEYDREDIEGRPPGSVGKDGVVDVTFARGSDGVTRLEHDYVKAPFHLMGGIHHDEHLEELVSLYIQNPTGSVVQGDRYRMDIEAREGTYAHVTTQSATKVHGMERNYAESCIDITVGEGAFMEFLPDPTILYEGARYRQSIDVEVADDATVLLSETLVPGRLARDESFEYERYHSCIQARHRERPVFTDTISLDGGEVQTRRPGVLGEFYVLGNLYVVSTAVDAIELSDRLHERVSDVDGVRAGASTLPSGHGVVVRVLGTTTQDVTDAVYCAWDETRRALLGIGAHKIRKY